MSFKATIWAWNQEVSAPTVRLVLLAVANRANQDGECWPSQARLAEDCRLSSRTVWASLKWLEENVFIRRKGQRRKNGTRSSDLIVLNMSQPDAPGASGESDRSHEMQNPVATGARQNQSRESVTLDVDEQTALEWPKRQNSKNSNPRLSASKKQLLIETADDSIDPSHPNFQDFKVPLSWLASGYSFKDDILPTIRTVSGRARNQIMSWAYFSKAISETHRKRNGARGAKRAKAMETQFDESETRDLTDALVHIAKTE